MSEERVKKPILHQSGLTMLQRCGCQFGYRYLDGIKIPPGSAALIGTGTHAGAEHDLRTKLASGEPAPLKDVQAAAADALEREWTGGGCRLSAEEAILGDKVAKGQAKDMAVTLAGVYHENLTPVVQPISARHIERPFLIILDNFPYDLAGLIDIQEAGCVRDLKTSGKAKSQGEVDRSLQLTFYAMAVQVLDGTMPAKVVMDAVVKTKKPYTQTLESTRTDGDRNALMQRIEVAADVIADAKRRGAFLPTNPDNWWCSPAWCGYWGICPYGASQAKSVSMSLTGEERQVDDATDATSE